MVHAFALTLLGVGSLDSHAGRPLTTEDATILGPKSCQLETWIDRGREASDAWFVPACNFGGGIEWQAGAARRHEHGDHRFSQAYAQAKTAFVSVDDHPWGVGLVLGIQRFALRETENGWSDPYATVPLSFKLGAGGALLHLNAGWMRDRSERRNLTTWGVAVEAPLPSTRLTLLGEAFGENARQPFLRIGGRWSLIEDTLDLDLTVVTRQGGTREERYVSLGLYYKADKILP